MAGLLLAFAAFGGMAAVKVGHAWSIADWSEVAHWLPFAIIFSLIGFGLPALLPWVWKDYRVERQLQAAHPQSPWLWRKEWAEGIIPHTQATARMRGHLLFLLLLWTLILSAGCFELTQARGRKPDLTVPLVGAAVSLGLVSVVAKSMARWWTKRDASVLRLTTLPATVGGRLTGSLELLREVPSGETYELELFCIRHERQRFGTREVYLWEQSQRQVSHADRTTPGRQSVPVDFEIPAECSPTDGPAKIAWRLYVHSVGRQTDFKASFEVPVFRLDNSPAATA